MSVAIEAARLWLSERPRQQPIAIAVSGGSDSLALLYLLAKAGADSAVVLTVDHHLRPESTAEATGVAGHATALGLRHVTLDWHWDGQGNLSEAAREGRYGAIAAWCLGAGITDCALGHTRGDNVESFFLGLMRGAGLDGLCGMRRSFMQSGLCFHRPLFDIPRDALRDVLLAQGLHWADDPSNENPAYDRARIRSALTQMGLDEAQIARSVANLAATRRDLGREVAERLFGQYRTDGPDFVLEWGTFGALSAEFRRRALSAALRLIASAYHVPRGAALARLALRDWQSEPGPATLHGCTIGLGPGGLRIGREASATRGPVSTRAVWDGRWRFEGAHCDDTVIRALGQDGLDALDPAWKSDNIPRRSMLAAPSVWRDGRLVFCPFGRLANSTHSEHWLWSPRSLDQGFVSLLQGQVPPVSMPG